MSFKSLQDYQMTKSAGYDLLFFENRRTPMIVRTGASYRTEERYGRLISRRPATRGELEQLKSGMFVRNLEPEDTPYNEPEETPVEKQDREKSSYVETVIDHEEDQPFAAFVLSPLDDGRYAGTTRAADREEEDEGVSYGLPGGKIDPGEDPVTAVIREAAEEGWDVEGVEETPFFEDTVQGKKVLWYLADRATPRVEYKEKGRILPVPIEESQLVGFSNDKALETYLNLINEVGEEDLNTEEDPLDSTEKSSAVIMPVEEEDDDLLEEDFSAGRRELEAAQREMMIADAVRNAISSGAISAGASGLLTGGFTAAQPGATGSDIVGRSLVGAGIGGVSGAGLSGFLSWLDGRSGKDFIDKMGPEGLYAGAEVTHPGVLRHPDMWQGGHLSPYGRDRLIRNSIGIL